MEVALVGMKGPEQKVKEADGVGCKQLRLTNIKKRRHRMRRAFHDQTHTRRVWVGVGSAKKVGGAIG